MEEKKTPEESQEEKQDKFAEAWDKMAEPEEKEETISTPDENVDEEALAQKWEKITEDKTEKLETVLKEKISDKESLAIEKEKLEIFMDIPLEISVEIGQTELPLEEILRLAPNSIVELDKFINQPVDLKVNGKLVAKGELYTVENHFAIKITSIITAQERLKLFSEEFE